MTFEDKCKRLSRPTAEKVGISTPNCLIVGFLLMSDKRQSGEEGGKKREREAVAEGPGKRVRLKREPKEEPKEAKDPKVKVEDEEIASSSALSAPAPAPAPAPAAPPPVPPAPPAPIPAFPVDVFAQDMYDVQARRAEGNISVLDLGDRPQGVISLHLGVSPALWRDIRAPQRQAVVRVPVRPWPPSYSSGRNIPGPRHPLHPLRLCCSVPPSLHGPNGVFQHHHELP